MTDPTLRAKSTRQIQPLIELCEAGQLFAVQEWIAAGKPVNPPLQAKRRRTSTPLETAVEHGFHSLVEILLKAGAVIEHGGRSAVNRALENRAFEIVRLLIGSGADLTAVDMRTAFDARDAEILAYLVDRGADVVTGNPLAYALCHRIRPALRVFKDYRATQMSFQEQADIALRFHCLEGNMKWISLLLAAGANPYSQGVHHYDSEPDAAASLSALDFAALHGHFEVFELKRLRLDPRHPTLRSTMYFSCKEGGFGLVERLLQAGLEINDQEDGGCSTIQSLVAGLGLTAQLSPWSHQQGRGEFDTSESREKLKAIHLLAKYGARWAPNDAREIKAARRSLLNMTSDHTVEFVWIMAMYKGCSRDSIHELLHTPSIRVHVADHELRIRELVATW